MKDFENTAVVMVSGTSFYPSESIYMPIHHVTCIHKIFPTLYQHKPDTIIIDYEFLDTEAENIIRRIRTNPYYKKLKICCLKSSINNKADSLLKAIGVDFLIYKNDFMHVRGIEQPVHDSVLS